MGPTEILATSSIAASAMPLAVSLPRAPLRDNNSSTTYRETTTLLIIFEDNNELHTHSKCFTQMDWITVITVISYMSVFLQCYCSIIVCVMHVE